MKLSASMQISAANLLIASGQGAKAAPAAPAGGAFAAALATEKPGFAPLAFKQIAAAPNPASAAATPAAASSPIGSRVDIRV